MGYFALSAAFVRTPPASRRRSGSQVGVRVIEFSGEGNFFDVIFILRFSRK